MSNDQLGLRTVKDLIRVLQMEDPDRVVLISKDAEGNGFLPLATIYTASCRVPDDEGEGEEIKTGLERLTDDLRRQGFTSEDILQGEPAVVLVPTG